MIRAIPLTVMLIFAAPARAEVIPGEKIIVIEGDTVALPCARPAPGCAERLRLYAIDAPETRGAACEAEAIAGLEARAALRALLTGPVEVARCEPATGRCADRYGRTLGALRTAAGDLGQLLLASGNALPWRPGAAAKFQRQQHWCGR